MRTKLSVALIAAGITSVITAGAVSATVLMGRDTPWSGTTAAAAATAPEPPTSKPATAAAPPAEPVVTTAPVRPAAPAKAAPAKAAVAKATATKAAATKTAVAKAAVTKAAAKTPLTYVVKRGDDLSSIAAWFALRGYGELFQANRAVIGDDPDLILPGQRITISGTTLTMH